MSKEKARTKKSQGSSESASLLSTLIKYSMYTIVALGFVAAFVAYAKAQIRNNPAPIIPISIVATPSPTATPTINPNPIITCSISASCGGGSEQLKKSVCDNMTCCLYDAKCGGPKFVNISTSACKNSVCCGFNDGTWKIYPSNEECDKAQAAQQQPAQNVSSTYVPPTYYTCTLYYPALHTSSTYTLLYKTKEECDTAQASLNASEITNQIQQPTPTPDVSLHNLQVQQCQNSVVQKYSNVESNCNTLGGDSSATQMCIYAYSQERQKEYDACGKKM